MANFKYSDELLAKLVAESTTTREVCEKLGVRSTGNNQTHLNNRFKRANIDKSHFIGFNHMKGKKFGPRKPITDYFEGKAVMNSHGLKLRMIREGIVSRQCNDCKLVEWKGVEIPLELHHIDGNHSNNARENLEVLCPNCHSLTYNNAGKVNKKEHPPKTTHGGYRYTPKTKIEWPSNEELQHMLWEEPTYKLGKRLGISDKAIIKRAKKLGLTNPGRGYWLSINADWSNISSKWIPENKWPTKEILQEMILKEPMVLVAKRLGVGSDSLSKKAKELGLRVRTKAEWTKIRTGHLSLES